MTNETVWMGLLCGENEKEPSVEGYRRTEIPAVFDGQPHKMPIAFEVPGPIVGFGLWIECGGGNPIYTKRFDPVCPGRDNELDISLKINFDGLDLSKGRIRYLKEIMSTRGSV